MAWLFTWGTSFTRACPCGPVYFQSWHPLPPLLLFGPSPLYPPNNPHIPFVLGGQLWPPLIKATSAVATMTSTQKSAKGCGLCFWDQSAPQKWHSCWPLLPQADFITPGTNLRPCRSSILSMGEGRSQDRTRCWRCVRSLVGTWKSGYISLVWEFFDKAEHRDQCCNSSCAWQHSPLSVYGFPRSKWTRAK